MGDKKDLQGKEAIEKIHEIAEATNTCMFCTHLGSVPFAARPMAVQQVDDEGRVWFLSNHSSNKDQDIKAQGQAQLIFAHPDKYEFLSLYGTAESFYDREKIEALWSPLAKAWFPEGKDDPNLSVIKFSAIEGHYWDTQSGKLVSLLKIVISAATVNRSDDGGVEGGLNIAG